ncbi:MAG: thioesterase family protein [Bacteriovoracales bacterium]|nr:thioesterase family protein [Bacteriovoracales bacterium]
MLKTPITPRFNDTDALGHVNHSVVATWFETARRPLFSLFCPSLSVKDWNLIVVRIEIDYKKEILYQDDVKIETTLEKIGNSSFTVIHRVRQKDELCAEGKCVLVHFDYRAKKPQKIPEEIRAELEKHLER